MSKIIFARPRHDYGSYWDFLKLIQLSGFPLIYFDEIDPHTDDIYVMTIVNGENQNGWPDAKAKIILWDIEWRLDGEYPRIPGVTGLWTSDRWYAQHIGAQYVPFGSHPGLALTAPNGQGKVYDAAMLAYMSPRRTDLEYKLIANGVRLAPRGWDMERDAILHATKIMLQVHQRGDAATIAPQRFALAAAYKMPVITETIADPGIFTQTYIMQAHYDWLPHQINAWKNDQRLNDYAAALNHLLCEQYTFRKCVEAAL